MPQLFQKRANAVAKAGVIGVPLALCVTTLGVYLLRESPFGTGVNRPLDQPVPFSHEHHVAGLGIDCRYCHASVEESPFAGLPSTETCMTCHSQVWKDAPMLQPVRDSLQNGQPLRWTRVHTLPHYVYFDHSIHVQKGVGCVTCHGQVDQMPITWKTESLEMRWCLECHRAPERFVRPVGEVFNMHYERDGDPTAGRELIARDRVHTTGLTDCYACHR
jgi:hypothetical protein